MDSKVKAATSATSELSSHGMSQPNVSSLRGPWRSISGIELGVLVSNELRYEITPIPSRYGQSHTALRQSSEGVRLESVAVDTPSSAKPIRIATISFQITAHPVKSRISLAATNGPGWVVVSGEPAALDELVAECEADDVRARRIAVDYASHSVQVDAIRDYMKSGRPVLALFGTISEADGPSTEASDGVEALAYLRQQGKYANSARPDLVLLDLNLPKKDGREVLAGQERFRQLLAL